MASRSQNKLTQHVTTEEFQELLDGLEKLIDRTKTIYEQYFMGIQKMAPAQLHRDVERKVRELTQMQIRNTSVRFRFNTLTQKFGAYNTYWKRTMRQIELGTYTRHLARVGRKAAMQGEDVPEEMLASMPKLMRERIVRERAKLAERRSRDAEGKGGNPDGLDQDTLKEFQPEAEARPTRPAPGHVHRIAEDPALADSDYDLDAMFANITAEADAEAQRKVRPPPRPGTQPAAGSVPPPPPRAASAPPSPPPRAASVPPPPPTARGARGQGAGRPPGTPLPPGMSERDGRVLYDRYMQARRFVGERPDDMSYDKLMRTLSQQAPKIMKQHQASAVDFNVVIKGDKVVLKAKPRK